MHMEYKQIKGRGTQDIKEKSCFHCMRQQETELKKRYSSLQATELPVSSEHEEQLSGEKSVYSRQPHHQEYQLLPTPDPSHQKEKRYRYLLTTAKRSEVSSYEKQLCICPTSLLVTFLQASKPFLQMFMDTRNQKDRE